MIKVEGKGGISAKIVLDSIATTNGSRITTFELEYPRFIHAEFMTHRLFSRNCASSRAIPFEKMLDQCTATPIHWGRNKSGMQAKEELDGKNQVDAENFWESARTSAGEWSESLYATGLHKQIVNRITEPFQMIKTVCTATEYANFFWLRNHEAAQPEIQELARCMFEAYKQSTPQMLDAGEWHLPYVFVDRIYDGKQRFYLDEEEYLSENISLEEALKVSAARCAAVSFRNTDYDLEKSLQVYERLVGDDRKHGSALEHQAKAMREFPDFRNKGVTHLDREGNHWSANFKGWIQHRKLIEGEAVWSMDDIK